MTHPREGWFGPTQATAWTEFYLSEEREQTSYSTSTFARMLVKHGAPDCGNPLPNDDESHFLIHSGGFIAGEIDRCLRATDSSTELEQLRGERSLDRLGLLSHVNCPMISARTYWADDDMRMAMTAAAWYGRWELFGARAARVVVNALRHGLLDPLVAPGTLVARRLSEEVWHTSPWSRPLTLVAQEAPPVIHVAAWRARRSAPAGDDIPSLSSEAP